MTQPFTKSITTDDIHYNSKTVQKLDDVRYNSKTIQKLTVTDKVKSNDRRGPIYTEEAKIQIYAKKIDFSDFLIFYIPYACHYSPWFVYFLPHFLVQERLILQTF